MVSPKMAGPYPHPSLPDRSSTELSVGPGPVGRLVLALTQALSPAPLPLRRGPPLSTQVAGVGVGCPTRRLAAVSQERIGSPSTQPHRERVWVARPSGLPFGLAGGGWWVGRGGRSASAPCRPRPSSPPRPLSRALGVLGLGGGVGLGRVRRGVCRRLVTPGGLHIRSRFLSGFAGGEESCKPCWDRVPGVLLAVPPGR